MCPFCGKGVSAHTAITMLQHLMYLRSSEEKVCPICNMYAADDPMLFEHVLVELTGMELGGVGVQYYNTAERVSDLPDAEAVVAGTVALLHEFWNGRHRKD